MELNPRAGVDVFEFVEMRCSSGDMDGTRKWSPLYLCLCVCVCVRE